MFRKLLALACMAAGTLALCGADSTNVVQYTYDAAGNIVAMQRVGAALPGVAAADIIATARLSADGPAQRLGPPRYRQVWLGPASTPAPARG